MTRRAIMSLGDPTMIRGTGSSSPSWPGVLPGQDGAPRVAATARCGVPVLATQATAPLDSPPRDQGRLPLCSAGVPASRAEPGQVFPQDPFHPVVEIYDQPKLVIAVAGRHLLPVAHHRQEHRGHIAQGGLEDQADNDPSPVPRVALTPDVTGFLQPVHHPGNRRGGQAGRPASSPAVIWPLKLRMFRQFRSVALMPIRSAAA